MIPLPDATRLIVNTIAYSSGYVVAGVMKHAHLL